jgi:hypothetical protein
MDFPTSSSSVPQRHEVIAHENEVFPPQETHAESAWRWPSARQMCTCNNTGMNLKRARNAF